MIYVIERDGDSWVLRLFGRQDVADVQLSGSLTQITIGDDIVPLEYRPCLVSRELHRTRSGAPILKLT